MAVGRVQNANWQFISMEVLANLTRKVNNNNKIVVIINPKKTLPESRQQGLQRKPSCSHPESQTLCSHARKSSRTENRSESLPAAGPLSPPNTPRREPLKSITKQDFSTTHTAAQPEGLSASLGAGCCFLLCYFPKLRTRDVLFF